MSSKLKIVIVVFGLLALLYVVAVVYSFITTENAKDRKLESIRESFDELPNDPPKQESAPATKSDDKSDTKVRIEILDSIDKAYTDIPNASDFKKEKPVLFDKLLAADMYNKLKASQNIEKEVEKYIKDYFDSLKKPEDVVAPPPEAPTPTPPAASERERFQEIEKVAKLKDSLTVTIASMQSLLEDINPYLGTAARLERETSLKNFAPPITTASTAVAPSTAATVPTSTTVPTAPTASTTPTVAPTTVPSTASDVPPKVIHPSAKKSDVVEGFENVRHFAFF